MAVVDPGSEKDGESNDIYVIDDDLEGDEKEGSKKKIELTLDLDKIEPRKGRKKAPTLMSNAEKKKASHKHYTLAGLDRGRPQSEGGDAAPIQEPTGNAAGGGKKSKYGAVRDEEDEEESAGPVEPEI